jgi:hypothetical protein
MQSILIGELKLTAGMRRVCYVYDVTEIRLCLYSA